MKAKYILSAFVAGAMSLGFVACNDDLDYTVSDTPVIKSLTTGSAETTATTATVTGEVVGLDGMSPQAYAVGVAYSTDSNPTLNNTKAAGSLGEDGKTITATANNLITGQTYYYCTYVTLNGIVTEYGDIKQFVTTDSQVGTAQAAEVTSVGAMFGGTLNGVSPELEAGTLEYGFAIAANPALENAVFLTVEGKSNSYNAESPALIPATTYYYAAYMVQNNANVYGNVVSFTTLPSPAQAESSDAEGYVDMGVNALWAQYNVGAEKEGQIGGIYNLFDPTGLNSTESDIRIDLATAAGMGWTPSVNEWEELFAVSEFSAANVNGVEGVKLTSTRTGNSIFFANEGDVTRSDNSILVWTSDEDVANSEYVYAYVLTPNGATKTTALASTAIGVRAVRNRPVGGLGALDFNKYLIVTKEDSGNYRMDIYNEWDGSDAVDGNCAVNREDVKFSRAMTVNVKINKIPAGEWKMMLGGADGTWGVSLWDYEEGNPGCVLVTEPGEYNLTWFGTGTGLAVCYVDILGLGEEVGTGNVDAEITGMQMDSFGTPLAVNAFEVVQGDIEGNGNYRIDMYNEWDGSGAVAGSCGYNVDELVFNKKMGITFTISGVPAGKEYFAQMAFVDGWWALQQWADDNADAEYNTTITGDGTYTLTLSGEGHGTALWYIDILGLAGDADAENINVTVDGVSLL